jgi:replicative superfamily II helicase
MKSIDNPQTLREKYIREIDNASNKTARAKELAEDLFNLDLTVYSNNYSFKSIIYNAFAISEIDSNIAMHPEQLQIVSMIKDNAASIISAPTSFGKTFCIFEYIVKYKPRNVVLIVPTLALVDEYFKKIIKKYKNKFSEYKIHTSISEEKVYNFNMNNIFILTHDRVVQ